MLQKIQKAVQLIGNMGWRYIFFRSGFELKKRTGFLKTKFPVNPATKAYYSLDSWKLSARPFFFQSKEEILGKKNLSQELQDSYRKISEFRYSFFSSLEYDLESNFDWVTNPDSGFRYDPSLHWLDINDYDQQAGDIKFVWEPSRFSHLYTIIRYDFHSGNDCSTQVFKEIERWIDANHINQGPNFKCSQEISLRVMNWTFALYYYKNSPNLTQSIFDKIQHYIYWQVEHVYQNINFSRIAVRNNHAITETLLLYVAGLLFPDFPESKKWKQNGKRWFEQEIAYQIYEDGTFLQFSMNYHRVVIQLLTWALRLAELNGEAFQDVVYLRAKKSVSFLLNCMENESGWLPNYGNNDGALFFKLNDQHYRDYRPQLEGLSYLLNMKWVHPQFEDALWYGLKSVVPPSGNEIEVGSSKYEVGGFYTFRNENSLTFVRCGNHRDRPAQADNLHLDIWYEGKNILHDGGTYKYNSNQNDLKYFMGTHSHNTVMLGDYDQMEKGSRFIWYHWTQCVEVNLNEDEDSYVFEGTINAFQHIDKRILHTRRVKILKNVARWEVTDHIINKPDNLPLKQLWHTSFMEQLNFSAALPSGEAILPAIGNSYYSSFYGVKVESTELVFSTDSNSITTVITVKL